MAIVFFRLGHPVEARVVKQTLDLFPNAVFSPIFEVTSGEYAGISAKSTIGTSFGTHSKGSVLKARYLKWPGYIESEISLKIAGIVGLLVIFVSVAFQFNPFD